MVEGGGDVREVREGSRRRRLGCGGRPTRAREYAGDAPRDHVVEKKTNMGVLFAKLNYERHVGSAIRT